MCDELWMETYAGYVVAYDEDLDIAKRRINRDIWNVWSLNFAKNNNIGNMKSYHVFTRVYYALKD